MIAALTFLGFVAAGVAACITITEFLSASALPVRVGFDVVRPKRGVRPL